MSFSLKFSEVEATFATIHFIASDKRIAFQGRIKALLRLGLLPHVLLGRGRAAAYSAGDVFLLGIGLNLLELGLTPERAVTAATENLMPIAQAGRVALTGLNGDDDNFAMFLRFDPSGLDELREKHGTPTYDGASGTMFYAGSGIIKEGIDVYSRLWPRLSLLNVTRCISYIYSTLHDRSEILADSFECGLRDWLDSYPEDQDADDPQA